MRWKERSDHGCNVMGQDWKSVYIDVSCAAFQRFGLLLRSRAVWIRMRKALVLDLKKDLSYSMISLMKAHTYTQILPCLGSNITTSAGSVHELTLFFFSPF